MEVKKILITGGCGFIGLNLINYLQKHVDCEITVLDNESNGSRSDLPSNVRFIHGDVKNQKDCHHSVSGNRIIIHLAAQTEVPKSIAFPLEDVRVNVMGTLNLLEVTQIHHVERFIFASSNAVIGDTDVLPIDETQRTKPISPYGVSKLTSENYCRVYSSLRNLSTICLRFSNVYGKLSSHKSSVIAKFIRRIEQNNPIEIYGDGKQTRDFIHADDLSGAIVASMFYEDSPHETFCIASGKPTSINTVVGIIRKAYLPKEFEVVYTNERPGDIKYNFSSIAKAKELLKWEPKTSIEDGLKELICP